MTRAYYSEIDPYAAEWLRNLIVAGHIALGDVDTRSIEDVSPDDLRGYSQCHFFAGIGVWSYALRLAGWPDDRPVWTGSCPCQPFSAAGRQLGTADERHLWPAWFHLIEECRPRVIFGEQVEAAVKHGWLDLVQADLEGIGYAVGAFGIPAAGVGAPHQRARLWFVADYNFEGRRWQPDVRLWDAAVHDADGRGEPGRVANCKRTGLEGHAGDVDDRHEPGRVGADAARPVAAGRRPGFWSDCDWLPCRDGKARLVEPIAQQMVDGAAESLGRLRPEAISQIEAEVLNAFGHETNARKALHDLWRSLSEEAIHVWNARRLSGVHEAPFLLAFLRQLSDQGWAVAQGIPRAGAKITEGALRSVRDGVQTARTPQERGLDGQPPGEYPDSLRVLSSILARHAQAAWGETFRRHAKDAFPLVTGEPNRVGRLRAYGNAIVPQVAAEVIGAYLDCRP